MPSEWTSVSLGNLFELTNGYAFKSSDFLPSGLPVIKIRNVKPNLMQVDDLAFVDNSFAKVKSDKVIRRGDILITMSGNRLGGSKDTWVGKVAYFDLPGVYMLNQRVGILRPKAGVQINPKFCAYCLSSDEYQRLFISIATSSGGQANLSPSQIFGEQMLLPPLEAQNEIAATLSALDDKIALLRETNATLEALAQAMFKSWFVDFDPVRAKAEGRNSEGVPPEVADLFPSEFEDSDLGEIPKGWRVGTFADITDVAGGTTPSTKEPAYWEGGHHCWATPKDLSGMDTPVLLDTERKITDAGLAKISSGLLPVGTVLMSSRAPIGYLAVAEVPVAVNQGFIAMRPKAGISNLFLLNLVRSQMDQIKSHANGSTFMEISKAAFRPLKVVVPPMPIIQAFDDVARSLYERMVCNVRQDENLRELRDSLLPRLMTGKLRIPDAEALIEETT